MTTRVYAKIKSDVELEYAPERYNGISNFNNCEELMLKNGFFPVLKEKEKNEKFKYVVSEDKTVLEIETFDGKKKKIKTRFICKKYLEKTFTQLKEEKEKEIRQLKESNLNTGVAFIFNKKSYHAQMDPNSKSNILGIRMKISEGKYDQKDSKVLFKTFENEVISLTKEQFIKLADMAFDYAEYVIFEKDRLLKLLASCLSEKDLSEIIWIDPDTKAID